MTRVLVTGANGFIGRATLPLLVDRGHEVHAVTSGRSPIPGTADVAWHTSDLLDQHQVRSLLAALRPDSLLHLAWYAVPGKFYTSTENIRWVGASLQLIREFADHGGGRVVVAGSCAEYDLSYGFCSEELTPCNPATLYGASKHALQIVLARAGPELGLSVAWARIFSVHGPGEHPSRVVASAIRSLLRGEPPRCDYGGHVRDYLCSADVGSAVVHMLDSRLTGPVNVGSGHPISIQNLLKRVGEVLDRSELIAGTGGEFAADEPPVILADVRYLHRVLGWAPKFSLEEGLLQSICWWQEFEAGGET